MGLNTHPQKPVHRPECCLPQHTGREMKDLDLILQLMLLALCSPMLQAPLPTAAVLPKLLQESALTLTPMHKELSNPNLLSPGNQDSTKIFHLSFLEII